MANEVNIIVKMTEDITGSMKSMTGASRSLNKEFEALQRQGAALGTRYESLNKSYAESMTKAEQLKKSIRELKKEVNRGGEGAEEASKKYEELVAQYNRLTDAAKGYKISANETVKKINDIGVATQKLDEKQGQGFWARAFGSSTLQDGLVRSGIIKEAGNSLSNLAGTVITSAIGQPMADVASQVVSGTLSGIAAGSIAGPAGMLAGGVAGGVIGIVNAGNELYKKDDDSFKSYYKDLYETVNANTAEALTSGKTLAAKRETTKVSFSTLLGGETQADRFLADVLKTANTTPFLYDDLVSISKTMLSFGTAAEDVIPTLTKVGDAGAAMGLSTGDIGTVATYLGRMKSSNKASLEYLNPLMERGFSVFQWLADAKGTSVGSVYDMISKGQLSGTEAVSVILQKFEELYAGQMDKQSKTTEGLESTLQGLQENIQAAMGQGYNSVRDAGMSQEITAYGGELGKALETANRIAGENKAYLDNLQEKYQIEALGAVLRGSATSVYSGEDKEKLQAMREEYSRAMYQYNNGDQEAGLKLENIQENAQALAKAAFEASDAYQSYQSAELDQIGDIRDNVAGLREAWAAGLKIQNAFTIGLGGPVVGSLTNPQRSAGSTDMTATEREEIVQRQRGNPQRSAAYVPYASHAFGLNRVPFDGYLAMLHQGERVQTAEEARRSQRRTAPTVQITGNQFSVRSEEDIDAIAARLAEEIAARSLAYGG